MKRYIAVVFVFFFGLSLFALTTPAAAFNLDDYIPKTSKWGPDDEIGNCNYLTPKKILEAVSLIKKGRVIDMGQVYYEGLPAYPPRTYKCWLLVHGLTEAWGMEKATDMEEYVVMSAGIATQLDGFAHVGCDYTFYNGVKHTDIVSPTGAKKFGMENVPPIVTRGVLVDMVAYKGRNLGPSECITLEDFKACMKKEGVELRKGDALIIHTGWMRFWDLDPNKFVQSSPGIDQDIARYLVEKGIVGIGTDQFTTECFPHKGFPKEKDAFFIPCHVILLGNGIHLFQNLVTEELAKACAEDGKYEFLFCFTHPKLKGTVQGIGQPIAIK
jgi:kynurenine formamidase